MPFHHTKITLRLHQIFWTLMEAWIQIAQIHRLNPCPLCALPRPFLATHRKSYLVRYGGNIAVLSLLRHLFGILCQILM